MKQRKILVIEDDIGLIDDIQTYAGLAGSTKFVVIEATNFYEAREQIRTGTVDIVITDSQMPSKGLYKKYNGTMLNGWNFLCEMADDKEENFLSLLNSGKIIIFTAYLDLVEDAAKNDTAHRYIFDKCKGMEKMRETNDEGEIRRLLSTCETL